jgi:hypothetical protein
MTNAFSSWGNFYQAMGGKGEVKRDLHMSVSIVWGNCGGSMKIVTLHYAKFKWDYKSLLLHCLSWLRPDFILMACACKGRVLAFCSFAALGLCFGVF